MVNVPILAASYNRIICVKEALYAYIISLFENSETIHPFENIFLAILVAFYFPMIDNTIRPPCYELITVVFRRCSTNDNRVRMSSFDHY